MSSEVEIFSWVNFGQHKALVFRPWWEQGFSHGFLGASLRFDSESMPRDAREICRVVGADSLSLAHQVHGTAIIEGSDLPAPGALDCPQNLGEGDGIVFLRPNEPKASFRVYGIRTADCLPLIMKSGCYFALVHAGWRGLSAGIVQGALNRLGALSGVTTGIEVVIGPAASGARYEVGSEVLSAFEGAVSRPVGEGKFLLDLAATCRRYAESLGAKVVSCDQCTISNTFWHSYRRDGALAGRNLTFVSTSQAKEPLKYFHSQ